jgi:hypothetical protein
MKRAPRIENVVDDHNLAAGESKLDVAQDVDLPAGDRARAVARDEYKVDLGPQALAVQGPDEVGGEDETALRIATMTRSRGLDLRRRFRAPSFRPSLRSPRR